MWAVDSNQGIGKCWPYTCCWKILRIKSSDVECENDFNSIIIHWMPFWQSYQGDCSIRIIWFFDNVTGAPHLRLLTRWGLLCYFPFVLRTLNTCLTRSDAAGQVHHLVIMWCSICDCIIPETMLRPGRENAIWKI